MKNKRRATLEGFIDILKTAVLLAILIIILPVEYNTYRAGEFKDFNSNIPVFGRIDGHSMDPTLASGDGMLTINNKEIQRGDIVFVTIYNEQKGVKENIVKRVIGLPGDTVMSYDGDVYVNGIKEDESFLSDDNKAYIENFPAVTLDEDEYFICGDNRLVSYDSRYFGPVKRSQIYGVEIARFSLPFIN